MINKKKILPVVIIAGFLLLAYVVKSNPPTAKRGKPSSAPQLSVEVKTITAQDLSLTIDSYGTVKPRTQSSLFPQVSGEITSISDNFREGGFFEKGEVLLALDERDYLAEVDIASATLYNAQQALSEEQARVKQAQQDWVRLGNTEQAPDLVLRKPQLLAAQASVHSAQANLAKSNLALERTKIKAPYTGRILTKSVDIGQVVSSNTQLASLYAVDYVEIRLPIKNKDLPYLNLPENTRFKQVDHNSLPDVMIYSDLIGRQQWQGKIVRTEGAFDASSQQLFVVAQIDDPYGKNSDQTLPIKIGQYVTAKISGKVISEALVVPNKSIYQGSYVYVVNEGKLLRKNIDIAWQNQYIALIEQGVNENDNIVLTALGQVNSGTPVSVSQMNGEVVQINGAQQRKNVRNKRGRNKDNKKRQDKTEINGQGGAL